MADWAPLVTDPETRAQVASTVCEIVDAIAAHPFAGQVDELVDRAVLNAYIADDPGAAIVQAVEAIGRSHSVALFGGSSRVAWAVAHLTEGPEADAIMRAALAVALRATTDEFDLISGWVGWGVLALECGDMPLAEHVLGLLERTARPAPFGGLAWLTRSASPAQAAMAPHGYWSLGLAHGSAGVVALLARFIVSGVAAERARALLEPVADGLIASAAGGPFGGIWIDRARAARPVAWCYGDLGVACALLDAATVLDHRRWREIGLSAARRAAAAEPTLEDAALCHGTMGAAHLFARLHQRTHDRVLADASRRWVAETLARQRSDAIAGFPAWRVTEAGDGAFAADATLLEGASGVALALKAAIDDRDPLWDRLLLVDA